MQKYKDGRLVDMTPEELAARQAEIAAAEAPVAPSRAVARKALIDAGFSAAQADAILIVVA